VTHGQCIARPTVTFPASERHRPLTGTKLYCLVTEAHRCEKLAQSFYAVVPGRDSNPRPLDRESDTLPQHHDATPWFIWSDTKACLCNIEHHPHPELHTLQRTFVTHRDSPHFRLTDFPRTLYLTCVPHLSVLTTMHDFSTQYCTEQFS